MEEPKIRKITAAWTFEEWKIRDGIIYITLDRPFDLSCSGLPDHTGTVPITVVLEIPWPA